MINSVNCASAFANVGVGRCSFIPREVVGALIVSASFVISETNAADLQNFLQTSTKDPVNSLRVLPIHNFVAITDSSEDTVRETMGYGSSRTLRDGNYNWTLRFVDGGLCLLSSLQALNGQKIHVIFIDAAGNLIGTKKEGGLGGIPVDDFWANKWGASDGTNSANLSLFFSFKPDYINRRLAFIQTSELDFEFDSVVGLQDVELNVISAAAGSVVLKASDKCSGDDSFSDLFGAELATETAFEATGTDGTAQTITTVVYSPAAHTYTLTFMPVRSVPTILNLSPLDDLEGYGIEGYEGVATVVPVTYP